MNESVVKKCEKKSSSSSHCLHYSLSGKMEMSTESTLRWNTKKKRCCVALCCPVIWKLQC